MPESRRMGTLISFVVLTPNALLPIAVLNNLLLEGTILERGHRGSCREQNRLQVGIFFRILQLKREIS